MKKQPRRARRPRTFTLEDVVHFVIFRELDKLRVPFPYEKASRICHELRAAVEYRHQMSNPMNTPFTDKKLKCVICKKRPAVPDEWKTPREKETCFTCHTKEQKLPLTVTKDETLPPGTWEIMFIEDDCGCPEQASRHFHSNPPHA